MDYESERLKKISERLEIDSEVAIYPYGQVGHRCRKILENMGFLRGELWLVDNMSQEDGVLSFADFLARAKNPFIIVASSQGAFHNDFLPELFQAGFSAKQIGIVYDKCIQSYEALYKVLESPFRTLLDVGCGAGIHGKIFEDYGKEVTGLTMSAQGRYGGQCLKNVIIGDYLTHKFNKKYQIVWMSHILEHIVDVRAVLEKTRVEVLNEGGMLAITVPSNETMITLSHIHTFNAGRILRYLLYAGFDCRNAMILTYGFNLSIILPTAFSLPDNLLLHETGSSHSPGDEDFTRLKKLFDYLPQGIDVKEAWDGNLNFDGNISRLNWG